ncbi:helix-turn-helix domain-containing protein [Faecalimicrobium sp. JNUCC 81]
MFRKLKKSDYNWTFNYIKEFNQMVSDYEKKLKEKDNIIKRLQDENTMLKSCTNLKPRQKQISEIDVEKIKKLKKEGKTYSYISKETGWSKATISRVINNKSNKKDA